jgi:D-alanine-D-alanine ligase
MVKNVILLYGGKSGEHEISLRSAASVLHSLDKQKYHITPVGIDKAGCFWVNTYEDLASHQESLPVKLPTSQALPSLWVNGQCALTADVVFPVLHGPLYEDGGIQGLLTLADIAYVGCSVLASAMGMDKDISRRIACTENIQAAPYRSLSGFATAEQTALFCQSVAHDLGWPLFVKPCAMGSSVGIHKVSNLAELTAAVMDARRYDETILVEGFIKGREIELAVLEHPSIYSAPLVSLPGEIRVNHPDGFYSYAAKYLDSDACDLFVPALLDAGWVTRLQAAASEIFVRLKCKGMARVDFFVNDETGNIYFNEINTLPGFTSISMYPKLWEASGVSYTTLLDNLIELALTHHQHRQKLMTHYQ